MIEEKLNSTIILNMGFMGTGVYEEVLFEVKRKILLNLTFLFCMPMDMLI